MSLITTNELEAVLLAAGSATVNFNDIVEYYSATMDIKDVRRQLRFCIEELQAKYSGECGIRLVFTDNKILAFSTNPSYGDAVAGIMKLVKEKELSKSLLETLSIIAYCQPVTRSEIEGYRMGRSCDYAIGRLMQEGLIETVGQRDVTGRPFEYGTTNKFLYKFDLSSLDELPNRDAVLERFEQLKSKTSATNLFAEKAIDGADVNPEDQDTMKGILDEEVEVLEKMQAQRDAERLAQAEDQLAAAAVELQTAKDTAEAEQTTPDEDGEQSGFVDSEADMSFGSDEVTTDTFSDSDDDTDE